MPPTVCVVALPALSVAVAVEDRLSPEPVTWVSPGHWSTPDRLSAQVQWTRTSPLYQPAPFGFVVGAPDSAGGVLSRLMPPRLVVAVLPAASVAVPVALWLAPSVLRMVGLEQPWTPERASPQVKPTVTSLLYQPLALGARSVAPLMVGGVLSMLTVAWSAALFPALSVAWPVTDRWVPSIVMVCGLVQLATPEASTPAAEAGSLQLKLTVTSPLF